MNCFTEEQLNRITHLIREIEKLSDAEKLFLYLQLPCGRVEGKPKYNGQSKADQHTHKKTDQETTQTYTWILSHLESDPNVSLPKQEVYDEYRAFCQSKRFEPMCVADFGKAMKHAFPSIKPRRLGQRGNSRYCYSGLRKKYKIQAPSLPDMIEPSFCTDNDCSQSCNQIMENCQDNPSECPLNTQPSSAMRGYEVMNLKVEPSSPHNHQQQQQQTQYSATNGQLNQAPSAHLKEMSNNNNNCLPTQQTCLTANCHASMQSHPPASISDNSNYNPPSLLPMTSPVAQPTSAFSSYNETIRPPGTPDDDDYHHNYQDMLPMSRYDSGSVNMFNSHQTSRYPQTTSHYIYEPPPDAPKGLRADITNDHCSQNSTLSSNLTMSVSSNGADHHSPVDQSHINLNSMHQIGGVGAQFNLHQINQCTNFESCASPFQSPAPTPYPSMTTSYLSPEMPDYYSDECIRYAN